MKIVYKKSTGYEKFASSNEVKVIDEKMRKLREKKEHIIKEINESLGKLTEEKDALRTKYIKENDEDTKISYTFLP